VLSNYISCTDRVKNQEVSITIIQKKGIFLNNKMKDRTMDWLNLAKKLNSKTRY